MKIKKPEARKEHGVARIAGKPFHVLLQPSGLVFKTTDLHLLWSTLLGALLSLARPGMLSTWEPERSDLNIISIAHSNRKVKLFSYKYLTFCQ